MMALHTLFIVAATKRYTHNDTHILNMYMHVSNVSGLYNYITAIYGTLFYVLMAFVFRYSTRK